MRYWRSGAIRHVGDGAGACLHFDGRAQGDMQLRWWFRLLFGVLVDFCKIDGWASWGVLFGVLFKVMVRAYCWIDGRVLLGAFFGGCVWRRWCASTAIWGVCAGVTFWEGADFVLCCRCCCFFSEKCVCSGGKRLNRSGEHYFV